MRGRKPEHYHHPVGDLIINVEWYTLYTEVKHESLCNDMTRINKPIESLHWDWRVDRIAIKNRGVTVNGFDYNVACSAVGHT